MTRTDAELRREFEALMAPLTSATLAREHTKAAGVEFKLLEVEPESAVTGEFTAKISDWDRDRTNERFARHAFDTALAKLRADGRPIPVLFGHAQDSVQAVLGHVMPAGLQVTDEGLFARGWIDTSTATGRKVYEMLQRDVLRWSIGFRLARAHHGTDGVRVLAEVDELLELSAVPVPANSRTATLALKSDDPTPSHAELERMLIEAGIVTRRADVANYERADPIFTGTSENGAHDSEKATGPPSDYHLRLEAERLGIKAGGLHRIRTTARDEMLRVLTGSTDDPSRNAKSTRPDSTAPIQVATFDA